MDAYQQLTTTLSLSMGSVASGINLYAAILVLGLGGATDMVALPDALQVLENPLVIAAAAVMYALEFFADKIPGVDSAWDALHTFIRIPAGAMLAAGAVGEIDPSMQIAAGVLGGGITAMTHAGKAGTRALINTSPEPVTNWTASLMEDVAVILGLWTALAHPAVFLVLLVLFLLLLAWFLPRLWRGIRALARKVAGWFGAMPSPEPVSVVRTTAPVGSDDTVTELERLEALRERGTLSDDEFETIKSRMLR